MLTNGKWNVILNTPLGPRKGLLNLFIEFGSVTGTLSDEDGIENIYDGTKVDEEIMWSVDVDTEVGRMSLRFNGVIQDEAISGKVKFGLFGSGDFYGDPVPTDT